MIPVTLVLLAALAAVALLGRASAAVRHSILTAAVVCALAMPVLQRLAPSWLEAARVRLPHASTPVTLWVNLPEIAVENGAVAVDGQPMRQPARSAGFWLVLVWAFGSAISSAVLLTGIVRVLWLVRHSAELTQGPWREGADALSARMGVTRRVRLLHSAQPRALITWGWRRPSVLLPACAADWSADRIGIVLAHELAHVRRRDWLALMAAELLRCAHWFNPAVWAACRRLRRESELACDDEVLNSGVDARVYAEHLLELARTLKPEDGFSDRFFAPAMARPSTLERRIRAMLNSSLNRTPLSRAVSTCGLLMIVALSLSIAAVFAAGQNAGPASFSGSLLDVVGRTVPDVAIVLTSAQTRDRYEVRTDQAGHFSFPSLAPGDYDVQIQQPGFKTWNARVTIGPGGAVQRDISLQLGEVREEIRIRALADGAAPPPPPPPPPAPSKPAVGDVDPCDQSPVGGCVVAPKKVRDVRPVYPEQERRAARDATVKIGAVIGTDGSVRDMRLLSSADADFVNAAMDAISRWQFTATRVAGVPVDTNMIVTVNFEIIR